MKFIAALFLLTSLPCWAANNPATDEAASQRLLQDVERSKKKIEEEELKRRKILSALYGINRKVKKTVSEKSRLQQERMALDDSIAHLSSRIEVLDETSKRLQTRLAERLRTLYRLGGQSLARILFSASSSSELDRHLKIMGLIAGRDRNLIRDYRQIRQEIDRKREKLALRSQHLKDVEKNLASKEQKLVQEQALKSRLLDGIRRNRLFAMKNLQDLREKFLQGSNPDDGLFDLLFRPSFADQKGQLESPIEAPVIRKFGFEKSQEHPWTLSHRGFLYGTKAGTPVKSVFDGTVAFVGEVPGFGSTLILDHGDHYYSVYAGTADVRVRQGDEVRRQQVIAQAEHLPLEGRNGVYFEIRHFSEPTDPQPWMKGRSHE